MDIKYNIELTAQERQDLFVTAVEGGISYWAMAGSIKSSADGMWTVIRLHEDDGEETNPDLAINDRTDMFRIDDWVMQMGLDRLAKSRYQHHITDVVNDNADAGTADVIVQMALFGDILYG